MQHLRFWCTLHLEEVTVTTYINAKWSSCFLFLHAFPRACLHRVQSDTERCGVLQKNPRNHDASSSYLLSHVHSGTRACNSRSNVSTIHSTHGSSWPFVIVAPCCIAACVVLQLASFSLRARSLAFPHIIHLLFGRCMHVHLPHVTQTLDSKLPPTSLERRHGVHDNTM